MIRRARNTAPSAFVILLAGVAVAVGDAGLALGTARATADATPNPACPAANAPNALTLVGGSPQTAALNTAFAGNLQVALANTNGCPLTTSLAGVAITFTAPASGASGAFPAGGSSTLTVGTDASGMAAATMFTANGIPGTYTITASSAFGSVSFALTNTAAGIPAAMAIVGPARQSAAVATRFGHPLAVSLADADGKPLQGVSVTFTLAASGGGSGASGAGGAGASFTGGASQATVTTNAAGVATSPRFVAGSAAGRFTATAALAASATPHGSAKAVMFALRNRAGTPSAVVAGAAASESAATGARFPIRLAVTVTDANANPVPGAIVTFSAPARGPSGAFARPGRGRSRVVEIRTNAAGIAVAPAFAANRTPGGYVVRAIVRHAGSAAFALVNLPPGSQT